MTALLNSIADNVTPALCQKQRLNLGVNYVADLGKDNSDRNRTSPFAFTGNKFEFRMVGSSATLSTPNMVLNSIVAEMLCRISDRLENIDKEKLHEEVYGIVKEMYTQHKKVIFNGNNYSEEWINEAKKRGLIHIDNSIDAYEASVAPKNVSLFEKLNIMSKKELESRKEIYLSNYELSANIEAKTMLMMAKREILPAGLEWVNKLADDLHKVKNVGGNSVVVQKLFDEANATLTDLNNALNRLEESWNNTEKKVTLYDKCIHFRDVVSKDMLDLRKAADNLETQVSRKIWPFPTYADILFYE